MKDGDDVNAGTGGEGVADDVIVEGITCVDDVIGGGASVASDVVMMATADGLPDSNRSENEDIDAILALEVGITEEATEEEEVE